VFKFSFALTNPAPQCS